MVGLATETDLERLRQMALLLEAENARLHRRLVELTRALAAAKGHGPGAARAGDRAAAGAARCTHPGALRSLLRAAGQRRADRAQCADAAARPRPAGTGDGGGRCGRPPRRAPAPRGAG